MPDAFLFGATSVVEDFFKMAGIPYDLVKQDIDKKYVNDSNIEHKIELNNGKVLMFKVNSEMSNNLDSKYINMFENKKNSLLKSLLQINNKDI